MADAKDGDKEELEVGGDDIAITTEAPKRKPRRRSGSAMDRIPGRRPVKEYPLSEGELGELAAVGILATFLFALSSGLLGLAVDVSKDLALSTGAPETAVMFWSTLRYCAFAASAFFAALGVGAVFYGRSRVASIKKDTVHEDLV